MNILIGNNGAPLSGLDGEDGSGYRRDYCRYAKRHWLRGVSGLGRGVSQSGGEIAR